jgi:two-component system cell cycle sensor histidine kinase/response regulator CckA
VVEAADAEAALRTLRRTTRTFDLFVTDVVMPGMDGPTWVRQALQEHPGVKVVFVSGYSEEDVSEMSADIPNAVFLPKPFSLSDLTATVARQLH